MNNTPFDLTGKVAVITGSSRGIGRSSAELLAKLGAKVVVSSRKADACHEVAEGIKKDGVIVEADLEISATPDTTLAGRLPFPAPLSTIVQAAAREMVTLHEGNRSEAARRLGISRSRLHRLLGADGDGAAETDE